MLEGITYTTVLVSDQDRARSGTGVLDYPWGHIAGFQDPDGNRLQLREGR